MSYLKNETRKRNKRKRVVAWCVLYLLGIFIGVVFVSGIFHIFCCKHAVKVEATEIEPTKAVIQVIEEPETEQNDGFVPLDVPLSEEIQEFIYRTSCENKIEFPIVMALIETESSFRPNVVSKTNDYGLMQINKINHKRLTQTIGVTNYLDPYQNVEAGIYMLKELYDKYGNNSKVLMAYNMGEAGAKRLWKQGIYESDYSRKILNKSNVYRHQIYIAKENESYVLQ